MLTILNCSRLGVAARKNLPDTTMDAETKVGFALKTVRYVMGSVDAEQVGFIGLPRAVRSAVGNVHIYRYSAGTVETEGIICFR